MMSIRCKMGIHNWWIEQPNIGTTRRKCLRCKRWQKIMFYSNRTEEWVWLDSI